MSSSIVKISEEVSISLQNLVTGRGCVIGQSGSGKSFLIGKISEELCRLGMPFCIIDTEGEYAMLKKQFEIILVGRENVDVELPADYSKLFELSMNKGIPVIIDLSDVIEKDDEAYAALSALYSLEEHARKPYLVIIEEADKFAPQIMHKGMNIIEEISVRGRKRGIGLFVATQRPATISKNVLAQCSYGFIGKLTISNDLNAISILLEGKKNFDDVVKLGTGEFLPFGLEMKNKFKVAMREASSIGSTPKVVLPDASNKSLDLEGVVKALSSNKSISREKGDEKRNSISTIIKPRFSLEDAQEYAMKLSEKRFIGFGRAMENIDRIDEIYFPISKAKIRVGTGRKNEYKEYYFFLSPKMRPVAFAKKAEESSDEINVLNLSENEEKALGEIIRKRRISANRLSEDLGLMHSKASKIVRKLSKSNRISENDGVLSGKSYERYLSVASPDVIRSAIEDKAILCRALERKKVKAALCNYLPGAGLVSCETIYLPLYRITLRRDNKIREFYFDRIFGGPIEWIRS